MAALLAGADNSFECENSGLPQHQRIGASEPTQSKKYASLVLVTMVLGAAGAMMGFYVVGPSMSEHGTSQGIMFASEGHGMGKAMAKAYVADIEQTVDRMNNKELGSLFASMEHDMCDASVMPKVQLMMSDPRTTARLDQILDDPNFPAEVKKLAEQSLTQGSLNPLKSLGKLIQSPGITLSRVPAAASSSRQTDMMFSRFRKKDDKKDEKAKKSKSSSDDEDGLSDAAITFGAGAVGGLVGLQLFHDTTPAVVLCLLAAYGTTLSDGWGDSARTAGEVAVKVAKSTQKLNEKYELTDKLKSAADVGVAAAKDLDEEIGATDTIREKLNLDENIDKVTSKIDDFKGSIKSKSEDEPTEVYTRTTGKKAKSNVNTKTKGKALASARTGATSGGRKKTYQGKGLDWIYGAKSTTKKPSWTFR